MGGPSHVPRCPATSQRTALSLRKQNANGHILHLKTLTPKQEPWLFRMTSSLWLRGLPHTVRPASWNCGQVWVDGGAARRREPTITKTNSSFPTALGVCAALSDCRSPSLSINQSYAKRMGNFGIDSKFKGCLKEY